MANDLRFCVRLAASTPTSDQRECVTAMFWGSSGRRFKTCQPDAIQRVLSGPFGPQIGRRIPMKYPNELPTATNQQTLGSGVGAGRTIRIVVRRWKIRTWVLPCQPRRL